MTKILCIESATQVCSVSLTEDGIVTGLLESGNTNDHAANLTIFVGKLLNKARLKITDLDAIAVSKGPGSYTGLRIGVSVAKGYCYAAGKPLIAINTLEIMANGMIGKAEGKHLLCPMIDARRMEVYCALYNQDGLKRKATRALILDENAFAKELSANRILFFGSGAIKMKEFAKNPNAEIITDFQNSAAHMSKVVLKRYNDGWFENVAYFEPYYLKDFIAAAPRVKGL